MNNLCIVIVFAWGCFSYLPSCDQKDNWKTQDSLTLTGRDQVTETLHGIDLMVDSKDNLVSQWIKEKGTFNGKGARTIFRMVKPGDRVMNVGSHVAMESMVIGQLIGPTGRLYIFQPYSVSYSIALKNAYLNELENITTIFNIGCAPFQTTGKISVDESNTGASQIFIDEASKATTEEVYLDKLDNLVEGPIDFMLMDVERLEIGCLMGMKQIIRNSPNIIMYVEWGNSNLITNPKQKEKQILTWLYDEGFKFYVYDQIEDSEDDCQPVVFQEKSVDEIINYPYSPQLYYMIDITIVRSHIDPNTLF